MKLIYGIQHNVTKRIYVGCTENTGRVKTHLTSLKGGWHKVPLMQKDCDLFGYDFSVYMLEVVPYKQALDAERKWMHYFDTGNPKHGYNYRDKKAQKKSIDKFPKYTESEWQRRRIPWVHFKPTEFLRIIKEYVDIREWSIGELAEATNISEQRLTEMFRDSRGITQKEIITIADALDINIHNFI